MQHTIRNNQVTDIQLVNFSDSNSDDGSKEDDSPKNHLAQTVTPQKERSFSKKGSPSSVAAGPSSPQAESSDIESNAPEKSVNLPIAENLYLTHAKNRRKQRTREKEKKTAIEFTLNITGLTLLFIQAATNLKSNKHADNTNPNALPTSAPTPSSGDQDARYTQHQQPFYVLNFLFALSAALSFLSAVGLKTYLWERHLKDTKQSIHDYRNNKNNNSSDVLLRYLPLKLKEEVKKLPNVTTEELNELLPRMLSYCINLYFDGQTLEEIDAELEHLFTLIEHGQSEFNWLQLVAPTTLGASMLVLITQLNLTLLENNNLNSILAIISLFLLILATGIPYQIEKSNTNLPSYLKAANDKIIESETHAQAAISALQYQLTNSAAGITLFNHHANFFRLAIAEDNYRAELSNITPMFKELQKTLKDNEKIIIQQPESNQTHANLLLSANLINLDPSLDNILTALNTLTKTLRKVSDRQNAEDLLTSIEEFQTKIVKNAKLQLRKEAYNNSIRVSVGNAQYTS